MFDIGWSELLVIAVVLIVVVGPKDLPPMLRAFGKTMTRFRKVAGEFRAQFDEALREADLDEVRQHIADAQKLNPAHSLREAMNPLRQMGNDIKADLQRSTSVDRPQPAETQMLPSASSMSVVETPPAAEPAPVIAPPPVIVAEEPAKPKAARKPRANAVEAPSVIEPAQVLDVSDKPKRAPRSKASEKATSSLLVEPAQVSISQPVEKPKRVPRKPVASVFAAETPVAAPPKSASARKPAAKKPANKKDDA
jgi:sec-independent protein translocase protein TatB